MLTHPETTKGQIATELKDLPFPRSVTPEIRGVHSAPVLRKTALLSIALGLAYAGTARANIKMPGIFSDHMVLQCGTAVPVWGWAAAGEPVSVAFADQQQNTTADANGAWKVKFKPMEANAQARAFVVRGNNTIIFNDVLVGEVWFCSGQSNMEWGVDGHPVNPVANPVRIPCDDATQQLVGDGNHPLVRISAHTRDHLKTPNGGWVPFSAENRGLLPALPSCTALLLHQALHVPVGIIVRCESSAPACFFIPREAVEGDAGVQEQIRAYAGGEYPKLQAKYAADFAMWQTAAAQAKTVGRPEPRKPKQPDAPSLFCGNDGTDRDLIGARYALKVQPVIPYAIRGFLWDQGENGTGIGGADMTTVLPALLRSWRASWEQGNLPLVYIRKNQHPAGLEAKMEAVGPTASVDNRGLTQDLHPLDKAAYAQRVLEQMLRIAYGAR